MIAMKYIRGEFLIDFLATFPFRYFNKDNQSYTIFADVCQLLKVLRIRKLYAAIGSANWKVEDKATAKIGFCTFLIIVYTHVIGCVIWFFVKDDYLWVAPTDFGAINPRMYDPWKYGTGMTAPEKLQLIEDTRFDWNLFVF